MDIVRFICITYVGTAVMEPVRLTSDAVRCAAPLLAAVAQWRGATPRVVLRLAIVT